MPEPVFVALLLADRVITEDNQKKAIIGTFTQFTVRQVPAGLPPWYVYAAVTNLAGEHPFSLNLVVDELARQVKRHRDKRRKRRETRAAIAKALPGSSPGLSATG